MSEKIPITCPYCNARLTAKAALLGQTRPCPNCKRPIVIAPPGGNDASASVVQRGTPSAERLRRSAAAAEDAEGETARSSEVATGNNGRPGRPQTESTAPGNELVLPTADGLPSHRYLDRLDRRHLYFICDRSKVIASWENNGQGWQIRAQAGMVSAVRNQHLLPQQGDFRLVEIHAEHTPEGIRLRGLTCYRLADRWALRSLARGEDEIVEKIVDHAGLNRDQKNAVRAALRERFMHEVWRHAGPLSEFLGNADFHSYQVLVTE